MLSMVVLLAMDRSRNQMEVNDPPQLRALRGGVPELSKIWRTTLQKDGGQDQFWVFLWIWSKDDINVYMHTSLYIY